MVYVIMSIQALSRSLTILPGCVRWINKKHSVISIAICFNDLKSISTDEGQSITYFINISYPFG